MGALSICLTLAGICNFLRELHRFPKDFRRVRRAPGHGRPNRHTARPAWPFVLRGHRGTPRRTGQTRNLRPLTHSATLFDHLGVTKRPARHPNRGPCARGRPTGGPESECASWPLEAAGRPEPACRGGRPHFPAEVPRPRPYFTAAPKHHPTPHSRPSSSRSGAHARTPRPSPHRGCDRHEFSPRLPAAACAASEYASARHPHYGPLPHRIRAGPRRQLFSCPHEQTSSHRRRASFAGESNVPRLDFR